MHFASRPLVAVALAVTRRRRRCGRPDRLRRSQPDQRVPGDRRRVRGRASGNEGAVQLRRLGRAAAADRARARRSTCSPAPTRRRWTRPSSSSSIAAGQRGPTSPPTRWSWSCRATPPRRRRRSPTSPRRRSRQVAIGVPASVPVGRYTRAVLEKAQLWTGDRGEDDRRPERCARRSTTSRAARSTPASSTPPTRR